MKLRESLIVALLFCVAVAVSCGKNSQESEPIEHKSEVAVVVESATSVEDVAVEVQDDIEEDLGDVDCGQVVIAKVNNQPLYLDEVLAYTMLKEKNLVVVKPEHTLWDAIKETRRQERDKRIKGRLYRLEAASDATVQASDEEVEQAFAQGVKKFGSEEGFLKFKALSSIDDLKAELALNVSVIKMIQKHVAKKIHITPQMKEEYYLLHKEDKFTRPPQAAVRVVFRFAENPQEWQEEAEKIKSVRSELEEALRGVTAKEARLKIFSGFTRKYSEHTESRYSYWHIYGGHNIQKEFWPLEDAAFEANENELSDVLELANGYCIFILDYKEPAWQNTYAGAEREIEHFLQKEQYESYSRAWMDSMYEKYGVEVIDDGLMCGVPKEKKEVVAE